MKFNALIKRDKITDVAPLAGAWIEITATASLNGIRSASLPSRERGLKYKVGKILPGDIIVAPLAGAWIEI